MPAILEIEDDQPILSEEQQRAEHDAIYNNVTPLAWDGVIADDNRFGIMEMGSVRTRTFSCFSSC
jgi:hypothetical protein